MDDEWDDLRNKVRNGMSVPSGLASRMMDEIERLQKRNALLEDVAVAANEYEIWCIKVGMPINKHIQKALDKLREVGDE